MNRFRSLLTPILIPGVLLLVLGSYFLYTTWNMWRMALSGSILMSVLLVVALTVREGRGDERERLHTLLASRGAFMAGLLLLAVAILVQSFHHELDPWLVVVLGGMTLGKIIGLFYGRLRN